MTDVEMARVALTLIDGAAIKCSDAVKVVEVQRWLASMAEGVEVKASTLPRANFDVVENASG